MYANREAHNAGRELIRALKGVHVRRRVIWGLDSATVLELHRLLLTDYQFESRQLKSILARELPFERGLIRKNLQLYVANRDAVDRIVRGATDESFDESNAGEVFRWLRFQFKSLDFQSCSNVLELVSRWEKPSYYMSVTFSHLQADGVLDVVRDHPDDLERIIEVLNENSGMYSGQIDIPAGKIVEMLRAPLVFQEGAL